MALTGTVSGVGYKKIVTAAGESWALNPFDNFGKPIARMIIEADTTLGALTLNLPETSSFNGQWNTEIEVIATTGTTNAVTVNAGGTDVIGSVAFSLNKDGQTAVLTIASEGYWNGLKTA